MRSGELFAGVGGLGMAVDEVFNAAPAWFCEFDDAPSKVLAHHFPDVPNFGDVRSVDWAATERVNILAGGFPCQDVSLAGRRRGMKDGTRSGLWSEFAKAIDEIRPDWVVIENVRGLLSADAAVDMEPCPLCVGDNPGHVLRALGAVLGDLAEFGFDAEWIGLRAADVGAPHGRFRVFVLAWPCERTTQDTSSGGGRRRAPQSESSRRNDAPVGPDPRGGGGRTGSGLTLLPTPAVVQNDGESVESWTARRERIKATGINGNGMGMPLPIAVQLLPTPTASEGDKGGPNQAYGSGGATLSGTVPHLLPTPNVAMSEGGQTSRSGSRKGEPLLGGIVVEQAADWGPYAEAIGRWEQIIGRLAPTPVRHDGKGGKPRLNPELTEWMMGWPDRWVTDPTIGLSRAEQLKACGNGVVPQQAAAALRMLLARPGVPAFSEAAAA